jgi:hypothetical protein
MYKFTLDMLNSSPESLKKGQLKELEALAKKVHDDKVAAKSAPKVEPPELDAVDIGMSLSTRINRMLSLNRPVKKVEPRLPTVDEVFARQAEREEKLQAESKVKQERIEAAREIAQVLAQVNQESKAREGRYLLNDIPPDFVRYCQRAGMDDPIEIAERWRYENGQREASRYMVGSRGKDRYF